MPTILIAYIVVVVIVIIGALIWMMLPGESGDVTPGSPGLGGLPFNGSGGGLPGGVPSTTVPPTTVPPTTVTPTTTTPSFHGFKAGDYLHRPDGTVGRIEADGTMRAYASSATYVAHGSPRYVKVSTEVFNSFPRGPNFP